MTGSTYYQLESIFLSRGMSLAQAEKAIRLHHKSITNFDVTDLPGNRKYHNELYRMVPWAKK